MHEKDNYLKTAELSTEQDRRRTQQYAHPTHAPELTQSR